MNLPNQAWGFEQRGNRSLAESSSSCLVIVLFRFLSLLRAGCLARLYFPRISFYPSFKKCCGLDAKCLLYSCFCGTKRLPPTGCTVWWSLRIVHPGGDLGFLSVVTQTSTGFPGFFKYNNHVVCPPPWWLFLTHSPRVIGLYLQCLAVTMHIFVYKAFSVFRIISLG